MKRKPKAAICVKEFKAHIDDWCELRADFRHQASSIAASRKDLGVFVDYCKRLNKVRITGKTLVDFFAYLKNVRHNGSGAMNRKRSTLRSYCNHLRLKEVANADRFPIDHLPRARQPYSGPVDVLEPDEVRKLLFSINITSVLGYRDYTLYTLLYALGLRIGEAMALNCSDIDWCKGLILIHGKGRKNRTIPLTDQISALLHTYTTYRKKLLNADTQDALFISKKGNRLSAKTAEENFQRYVKAAGPFTKAKVVPHSLRHAFASHAMDGGADILVLKAILGHASLRSTEIYLHPSKETLRKAINDHLASDILRDMRTRRLGVLRIQAHRGSTEKMTA